MVKSNPAATVLPSKKVNPNLIMRKEKHKNLEPNLYNLFNSRNEHRKSYCNLHGFVACNFFQVQIMAVGGRAINRSGQMLQLLRCVPQ